MTESVSLSTTSTALPIAWDVMPAGRDRTQVSGTTQKMVLTPGQPGEVLFRARNNSNQILELRLEIQGDFPQTWLPRNFYQFTVAPQAQISEAVFFTVPDTFFEQQEALTRVSELTLQHQSVLALYASPSPATATSSAISSAATSPAATDDISAGPSAPLTPPKLVGHQVVDLYVRPVQGYLDFLPEIYQQSDFLGRFITIFEQAFEPTAEILDIFWAYLDPLTAPKGLLPFLAEWVAWPMNPRLTLKQQRYLIRHAVEIYQWRGSRKGLQLSLSLVTGLPLDDGHIGIEEDAQADFILDDVAFADAPMLGGGRPFHFSVTLRPSTPDQAAQLDDAMVRSLIEQEKPAFCTYDLTIEPLPVP